MIDDLKKAKQLYSLAEANIFTKEPNYNVALELIYNLIESGYYIAYNLLAYLHDYKLIENSSGEKAMEYYKVASDEGDGFSSNNLGYIYQYGVYCEVDYKLAELYYLRAVNKNYNPAFRNLALLYEKERKYDLAFKYMKLGADNNFINACFDLANYYLYGIGCNQDEQTALEYFIKDLRDYVKMPELPMVITEALTNSAKYSNELRAIQARVAAKVNNCSFIKTTDLYTNTFEPWHFGVSGNYALGNRIAAEIISLNDTRVVDEFEDVEIAVPYGVNVELPAYLKATFENEYQGLVKVTYEGSYDANTGGAQTVKFKAKTGKGTITGDLKVNVKSEIFVDGIINEAVYNDIYEHKVEGIGSIYVMRGETGFYFAAKITDTELWTDGEAWGSGDMGQNGQNDDFRIYLTTSSAAERITICLSSANLLRVYEAGTSLSGFKPTANLYHSGFLQDYRYHVTTTGLTNNNGEKTSTGMEMELFISYEDLGVSDPLEVKLCFNYSNVDYVGGKKVTTNNYYCAQAVTGAEPEASDEYYFPLAEILNCDCGKH